MERWAALIFPRGLPGQKNTIKLFENVKRFKEEDIWDNWFYLFKRIVHFFQNNVKLRKLFRITKISFISCMQVNTIAS